MENKTITLKGLEAEVAGLQAVVKDLSCQEKTLREALMNLNAAQVTPGTKSVKQRNLVPETMSDLS
jgi:uncharacterized protein YceH (UPF0502 family)